MKEFKVFLREDEIPKQWYNIQADLPTPLQPPLHPGTGKPIGPEDLAPVFPMNLIEQEVSTQRWIDIPNEVMEKLLIWRPTPLHRAYALEKVLGTPARIYYKNEGVSPPGSHKPNTSIPQAYYNKIFGIKRISTETGGAGRAAAGIKSRERTIIAPAAMYLTRAPPRPASGPRGPPSWPAPRRGSP